MAGTRRRLTAADRVEIALGLKAGWALRRIAAGIDRDVSVISREVARNSTKTRGYRMVTADVAAQRRRSRPQPRKVAVVPALRARVLADLKHSRTPRQIAGRLHLEAREATVGLMRSTSSFTPCPAVTSPGTGSSYAANRPAAGPGKGLVNEAPRSSA